MRGLVWRIRDAWVDWRVTRSAKRGDYDDPITARRRRARAARFDE